MTMQAKKGKIGSFLEFMNLAHLTHTLKSP